MSVIHGAQKRLPRGMVDGAALYREAIQTIDGLRVRVALLERAFTAYVTDGLEKSATETREKQSPPVLGFCERCGFPVYESEYGDGLYHYTGGRYQSGPIVCGQVALPNWKQK